MHSFQRGDRRWGEGGCEGRARGEGAGDVGENGAHLFHLVHLIALAAAGAALHVVADGVRQAAEAHAAAGGANDALAGTHAADMLRTGRLAACGVLSAGRAGRHLPAPSLVAVAERANDRAQAAPGAGRTGGAISDAICLNRQGC